MADNKLRYRELILILISDNKIFYKFFNQNKEYNPLLRELIKYDLDEDSLPSKKKLLKAIVSTNLPTEMDTGERNSCMKVVIDRGKTIVKPLT